MSIVILTSAKEGENQGHGRQKYKKTVTPSDNGKGVIETIARIKDKIYDLGDVLEKQEKTIGKLDGRIASLEKRDSFNKPPLRIDATLHLAWGLTMNLSGIENQVTLGQTLRDYYLKDFVGTYSGEEINDPKTKRYLDNLGALLSTYLRSVGYEKDVYDNYLDIQKKKRDQKIANINNLADFTSLSSESAVAKIASFVGIGSVAELLKSVPSAQMQQQLSATVAALTEQAKNHPADADKISSLISNVTAATNAINSSTVLSPDIALIIGIGFVGMVGLTLGFRRVRDKWTIRYIDEAYRLQQEYWESVARPSYFLSLRHLFEDVRLLVNKEYTGYKEPILDEPGRANEIIDDILPRTFLYVNNRVIFRWNRVPGDDEGMLKAYLKQKYDLNWIDCYEFKRDPYAPSIMTMRPLPNIPQTEKMHQLTLEIKNAENDQASREVKLMVDGQDIDTFRAATELGNTVVYAKGTIVEVESSWFGKLWSPKTKNA